ncbi:MAG: thioredoxin [Candidatus Pacebacteria bacterium CG10_big_fil_rev_8_21_14_0_10_36_11]|nr:thioredoxin [Candidatus Pacearchaeota archaeon]OIP74339.1 MAG: thioredoxin [Candidatus Pacebacteria bacterium CG2_30_36_39]PIR64904.1 MAG: thioredoxin [Candidatus Pacebacteria bacterium CG10_big_fil_rev_8_21_14_0_10_36_11]PJC42941.1 MAG: thioredoxin [Candidatus Pacebacteria bacterium CG_4_9_14_0_2_um_filter_36_8]
MSNQGAVHFDDKSFKEALKGDKPVFVDFFAEWCGPCQMAAPIIDKLADEFADRIVIAKLNVDENGSTAQEFGVMSIPTVLIFKKDKEDATKIVARQVGFPGEAGYRSMIEDVLGK